MAISAGSALLSAVGTGFTATGFVTAGSMFIGGTMLTHFLASTAIGAAINALTPKPTTPGAAGYTVTARGANLDHQIIYGKTRVAGAVVADFLAGGGGEAGTRFLHRIQVMAGHEIESYEEVYVNSYKVTEWKANTSAGGVGAVTGITDLTPWYNDPDAVLVPTKLVEVAPDGTETEATDVDYSKWNALAIQFWTGADDQIASPRLIFEHPEGKWTSDHRLRGRAYMYVRLGRDADGDNFPTGVPEITAVIKGRKVYDPREVSHDPDDKSTWAWSDNPALCIRDYLTQDFGLGERSIQVDDDLVETAANVCDQTADDGSTRYTCNGAFTTGIQPYDLLNSILTSMGGLLWYAQGQWRMKPAYWTVPTESFSEDDFRSAISVSTRHSRKDNFNTVEGTFRGPKSNYALTTFPAVDSAASITADGGTVSKIDLEMPFTDTPEEARRIARIVLERNRQQLTVRASFGLKAFRVQVGDVISLSLERFGWVNKTFEVTGWSFGNVDQYDIQIELTLREITESVFDEVDDGVTFELDNANVPSPLAGLTVGNLSVITNGFFSTDGTFINNLLVNWDAPVNSNVAEYAVEWRIDNFDYAANGGIVTLGTSPTNREVFVYQAYEDVLFRQPDQDGFDFYNTGGGSTLTEQEIRAQLEASAEGVAARSYVISGAKVNGTANEYNIYPVRDDEIYSVRVRAINDFGAASRWAAATVDASKDVTAPNAPTSLSATGGIQSVSLSWIAPTTNTDGTPFTDFREYIVYGGTSSSPTTEIGRTAGRSFTHAGLLDDTTYYYRVKAVDYSGNESAYSTQDSATTDAEIVGGASVLVVYADSAAGANQSLTPGSRRYVQYVEYTGTAPSLPVSGTFVLFVGDDGTSGQSIWPIYADDAAGNGQSFNSSGKTYVTFYESLTQPTLPVTGQTFVKYVGDDGVDGADGDPGADGVDGVDGTDGNTVALVNIYIRTTSAPSTPTGGSFNFDTVTLTPPSGWSASVPAGTDPIYTSVAAASIVGTSGTDSSLTWSTPTLLAQNGADGEDGTDGTAGKSVYTAIVFQRSATAPSAPSGGSFNFGTNVLTPPSGWYLDVPSGTDPAYGTRFVFSITGDTGSQTAGTWSTPFKIAEDGIDGLDGNDGADGISTYLASIFRRSSSAPSTPTGGSYNFGTNTLTPPSGWSTSAPAGTDPLYTSTALASIQGVTGIDSSLTWTSPVILARDGADGDPGADGTDGDRTYTGTVYYTALQPGTPGLPNESSVTFNESTGTFTGGTFSATPGWRHTQPSVDITDTSLLEWECQYRVTVSGALSYPQTAVPNTEFSFSALTSAIQVTTNIESDNFNGVIDTNGDITDPGTAGWAITRDGGNAVFNDLIARGTMQSSTFTSGSAGWEINQDGSAEFNNVTVRGDVDMTGGDIDILDTLATPPITVGVRLNPGTASANAATETTDALELYRHSTSFYCLDAINYNGTGIRVIANGLSPTSPSGTGDGIYVENRGTSGSTCIDAVSTRSDGATGPGLCQIALSGYDGGYGLFIPAGSENGGLDGSGNGFSPFTGTHMGMLLKTAACVPGDILIDHSIVVSAISDSFGEVTLSSSINQAGAIGVLQKRKGSWIVPPAFVDRPATKAAQAAAPEGVKVDPVLLVDPSAYHEDYDLVDINAVGEGGINVCGEGGNISKGDLIVTSSIPGKGMKQADDIVRSYTVAKAREDVTFSGPDDIKMIACIYLCG